MILEKRIPLSYWYNLIKWEVFIITLFSIGVSLASKEFVILNIPISISGFLGTSIALLLSFKLSQSYDRWWEARKIWGDIVNDSRALVMQLIKFASPQAEEHTRSLALRQISWCYALVYTLRNETVYPNKGVVLNEKDIETLKRFKNFPLGILAIHNEDLKTMMRSGHMSDFQYVQLDQTINRLTGSMGKLERIKNTVFPKTYRMTLRLFIYLFLIILSISLSDMNSWLEIPLLVAISIPFFLLERISKNIQNPFEGRPTDTPMLALSRTIEINIKQLIGVDDQPSIEEQESFYII